MERITHSLNQGSQAWHDFRSSHFGASELPAAAGNSNYQTREDLIKEKATGIGKDVSDFTQSIFDKGHRAEAGARPIAERIINDDLSPMVMSIEVDGMNISASLDGINFSGDIIFEHKLISKKLIAQIESGNLDEHYKMQMDQQLLVSGAGKCLFMISDGTENSFRYCWYETTEERKRAIFAIWKQFAIDLSNYKPSEDTPEVIAALVQDLPSLSIRVNGSISLISNLDRFGTRLNEFVAGINKEPTDDQGFANAEYAIKTLQNAQDALEAAESNALAQTSDIEDMRKTVKLYADIARTTRLMLEKIVKARKESIRIGIVTKANAEYSAYVDALEAEIKPIRLIAPNIAAADAIKGKRTIASLNEAVETVLRNGKIEASYIAAEIRRKLDLVRAYSSYAFLFNDMQTIIYKQDDDFRLLITSRIEQYKAAEVAKLESQRTEMQAEEERKELDTGQVEEQQYIYAQVLTKQSRPSDKKIIANLAKNFGVTTGEATEWILDIAKNMKDLSCNQEKK